MFLFQKVQCGGGATKALYCRRCVGKVVTKKAVKKMFNCIGVLRYVAGRATVEWMIIGVKNGPLRVDGLIF